MEMELDNETVSTGIEFDPVFIDVLEQLWAGFIEEREQPWSLAKLSKRSALPMSTLRRALTDLESAGLVAFEVFEDGRGYATLSEEGALLSEALFGFVMSKQSQ